MADRQSPSRRAPGSRQEPSRRGSRERQDKQDCKAPRETQDKQDRKPPRETQGTKDRQAPRDRREQMIHCDRCGEDYSATYRRCPFCDERANGGKRQGNRRGGGYGAPVNPVQVASVVIGLVIIIAAVYILFTRIGPFFFGNKDHKPDPAHSSTSQVDPNSSGSQIDPGSASQPDPNSSGSQIDPGSASQPDPGASQQPPVGPGTPTGPVTPQSPAVTVTSLTLDKSDFTLAADEHITLKATVVPQDAGKVTWSCDHPEVLKVSENGTVININSGSSKVKVTVTASIGDKTATCTVYCKPSSKNTTPTTPTTPNPQPSAGTLTPGTSAVITGASNGLNVRSAPSKDSEVLASIQNGNTVIIKEDAGNGWYKIDYGNNKLGYISSSFVKAK